MGWDDKHRGKRSGGSGGFDNIPEFDFNKIQPPQIKLVHIVGVVFLLIVFWLVSGFYRVELQEQAVVLIFGEHAKTSGPGLNWNLPSPIGQVIKVRTEELKKIEVGFRTGRTDVSNRELQKEREMLTMGTNIVDVQMSVQYVVKDPVKFLFAVADRERVLGDMGLSQTVKSVAEAALRDVVGNTDVDAVLTDGKDQVQQDVHALMQNILDRYECGVSIRLVQLQDVDPPTPVADAFADVNNAEEDKNRLVREAEGYRNSVIPEARGQAAQIIANAEAYRAEKTDRAKGDALRFEAQLFEYRKAPTVTKKRLYIEAMESVMGNVDKVIVDPSVKSVLPLLNLGGKNVEVRK